MHLKMPEYKNFEAMKGIFDDLQDYGTCENDLMFISSTNALSLYNNHIDSNVNFNIESPMSTTSSLSHIPTYMSLDDYTGEPHLIITEQPVEKFRFRYKSEMIGTHGSLVAASNTTAHKKCAPTVQLRNFQDKAIIRCTLVTSDDRKERLPHAHHLVRRTGHKDQDDPHEIEVSQENGFTAAFHGMGIIHTAKKHIKDELVRKLQFELLEERKRKNINAILSTRDEVQIKADADIYQKSINLNSVSLCFQAFIKDRNNIMTPLTEPVYSNPINNLKSALTGELKICRIDKFTSSCEGGEEVFILVEKVGKKNIRIKFFELNEDIEVWSDYGRFSELDVHHQYAIVFRTPPYKDMNITSSKEVFIQLERPSDHDCSEPIKFTYKPSDKILGRKRPRTSYSNSIELAQSLSTMQNNDSFTKLNDSQEISKELKDILLEGCSSSEYRNFLQGVDLDKYMKLLNNSEEEGLTWDGPSTKKLDDDIIFAKNIVFEAINIVQKEINNKNGEISPNKKKQLKKLLMDRSTYGDSPLHVALRYGQRDLVKYILILMGTDPEYQILVNIQNSSGKTPLHYAVLQNQPIIIKALLTLGADPSICDDHGFSPLHTAVRIPNAGACVDTLLSNKLIDIESYNDLGWTSLQLAAEAGSYDAVCSLVRAGANVNNTDKSYGRTVLHIAVEGGHKEIVEFLLRNSDIDINKSNFSGNTALHTAVAYSGTRAKELCKLLMEYGADPHIQNNSSSSLDDMEQEINEVNIKVEVESEEENIDETVGQSSFDLATNKPEILQLLMGHDSNTQEENKLISSTKEEILNEDTKNNWLNNENKQKLAAILDKTKGWEKLAKHLNLEFLLQSLCQNSLSPSLLLLNYIDVQGDITLTQMHDLLNEIKEVEAALFIIDVVRHQ
ncbi:nuclear factor NF-kappa-B p100 subunit isoform X2 [Vespula pensylvanica]|uniref:nuclear factor NF-kappa-B p100 subunit isoform X2 n=1 Tax=Vespula pensylvanica TaxID=30213 RepID=UPI001CBA57A1|nr:nuclear factor NF-kappa-B p100 subunit isoform X2 [Vespula pensylvanica]